MRITRRQAAALVATTPFWSTGARAAETDVQAVMPLVTELYRDMHEHPELGRDTPRASEAVRRHLRRIGGFAFHNVAALPTAIIASIDTGRPGPCKALRAELDARPIADGEPADHDPRSQVADRMHTCGHDAHAAMLLGAAAYVSRNRDAFTGRLVFVFQPAEETRGGADEIVADGVLARLGVQAIFAQHVAPGTPVGAITLSRGAALAGSTSFTLRLSGSGSHAAVPFEGADLPVVTARFIEALAEFPARHLDIANRPVVISPTNVTFEGGASNVMPSAAAITGTIRSFEALDEQTAGSIGARLRQHLEALARAYNVTPDWRITPGSPPTVNNSALFEKALVALRPQWGEHLLASDERGMFSEDFAFYTATIPALYFGLGIQRGNLGGVGVHDRNFTLHPDALPVGVRLLVDLAAAPDLIV